MCSKLVFLNVSSQHTQEDRGGGGAGLEEEEEETEKRGGGGGQRSEEGGGGGGAQRRQEEEDREGLLFFVYPIAIGNFGKNELIDKRVCAFFCHHNTQSVCQEAPADEGTEGRPVDMSEDSGE